MFSVEHYGFSRLQEWKMWPAIRIGSIAMSHRRMYEILIRLVAEPGIGNPCWAWEKSAFQKKENRWLYPFTRKELFRLPRRLLNFLVVVIRCVLKKALSLSPVSLRTVMRKTK